MLGSKDINIESLDTKKIDGIALLILRVNQYGHTQSFLLDIGWNAITWKALLVRVKDEPDSDYLAKRFRDANLHLRGMRIVQHHGRRLGAIAVNAEPLKDDKTLLKDELLEGSTGH